MHIKLAMDNVKVPIFFTVFSIKIKKKLGFSKVLDTLEIYFVQI